MFCQIYTPNSSITGTSGSSNVGIGLNNHLPGMTPAEEVKEKGLQIGETERILTEKVEELTLYILQLSKEIEALKEQK